MTTKRTPKPTTPIDPMVDVAEVETLPAPVAKTGEQYIAEAVSEIQKLSQTDAGIENLRSTYGNLKCNSLEDRPIYFAIAEGYKQVRNIRLSVERKRKELNEFPLAYQRAVNAEAKRITDELVPLEEQLAAEKTKFEDAEAAAKAAEEKAKKDRLVAAGFRFDGNSYTCGMHIISAGSIAKMEDAQIEFYESEGAKIRDMEAAAELRRKQEAEELKRQREEIEALRRQMAEEKAELERKLAEASKLTAVPPQAAPVEYNDAPVAKAPEPAPVKIESPTDLLNAFGDVLEEALDLQPVHSMEYLDGYEHCRQSVLAIFADPTPRTRAQFVEQVKSLQP